MWGARGFMLYMEGCRTVFSVCGWWCDSRLQHSLNHVVNYHDYNETLKIGKQAVLDELDVCRG